MFGCVFYCDGSDGMGGVGGISGTANLSNSVLTCAGVGMDEGDDAGGMGGRAEDVETCWDDFDCGLSSIGVQGTGVEDVF